MECGRPLTIAIVHDREKFRHCNYRDAILPASQGLIVDRFVNHALGWACS